MVRNQTDPVTTPCRKSIVAFPATFPKVWVTIVRSYPKLRFQLLQREGFIDVTIFSRYWMRVRSVCCLIRSFTRHFLHDYAIITGGEI
jgi:hypothetical protein